MLKKHFRIYILFTITLLSSTLMSGQELVAGNRPLWKARSLPQPVITAPAPLLTEDTVTLCILGDVMMHTGQLKDALAPKTDPSEHGSYRFNCFRFIEKRLKEADLSIANMEFTLAGPPFTGYPCFSAPDSYASYMAESGVDVFLTANNHILDKGSAGAERTLLTYQGMAQTYGTRYTGCTLEEDKPLVPLTVRIRGTRLALLNLTYGTNSGKDRKWPDINYLSSRNITTGMTAARDSGADAIIVLPHWGNEYQLHHSPLQRKSAEEMVREGADLIIGAHPHVVQDRETISLGEKEVQVFYSLGNAVSNMSARNTQIELMVHVRIVKKLNGNTEILPVTLTWLWCSRPGGYDDRYTVIPIADFLDRKEEWKNPYDYGRMLSTWERVKETTGIKQ